MITGTKMRIAFATATVKAGDVIYSLTPESLQQLETDWQERYGYKLGSRFYRSLRHRLRIYAAYQNPLLKQTIHDLVGQP